MKWSKYSKFFKSQNNGWLLYCASNGNFLKIEDDQVETIKGIMADPEGYDYSEQPMLYMNLRALGFIVEDSRDDDLYNIIKLRELSRQFSSEPLMLTIAITRACNFDCSYCFEGNRTGKPMSDEVVDKLIEFIRSYKTDKVSLIWYGGEPLLAFDQILKINDKVREMGKKITASMITNGYLLDKEKISHLNELNIGYLQITLDGKKETHDGRRYLKSKAPTYEKILSNLDELMKSDFKGTCHIRVNVDSRNADEFVGVYNMIRQRYGRNFGKRITVYPGFVKGDDHPDVSCFYEPKEQGEFLAKLLRDYGISPLNTMPRQAVFGCTLTQKNGFVVGPDGELYKCWDDVGLENMVVGHIDDISNWNMPLIAESMIACSYLDDPECKECFFFPVCNGGCHRIRQKNLHSEVKHSSCTYFKGNLEELLELHYERKFGKNQNT